MPFSHRHQSLRRSGQVDHLDIITSTVRVLLPRLRYVCTLVANNRVQLFSEEYTVSLCFGFFVSKMDMDNMLGGGGGAIGQFPLEQWFYEMPVCTRWWTAATVATSLLVQCQIITPFQLFYSFRAVFVKNQVFPRLPSASHDAANRGQPH